MRSWCKMYEKLCVCARESDGIWDASGGCNWASAVEWTAVIAVVQAVEVI